MRKDKEKWSRLRIRLVGGIFALFFVAVAGRSFYLQVLKQEEWERLAERQHQKTVPLTPGRGAIYDRNGAPFAVSVEMDSLFAEPKNVKDPAKAAAALAPVLAADLKELQQKLSTEKSFVWLQRRLTPDVAARVRALKLEGIGFVKESKRYYPNSEVASHVVG
ncbi:MAG TPA: penicillin-binding protein, partial [Verrucomicrobiae bacterium]|nr:penicillin-binding protein [Verrucomicrobiae bacterium]